MTLLYKTLSAAGSQITVTGTATTLKSLITTADSAITDSHFDGINHIELQAEDGDVRYSTRITPTTAIGMQLLQGQAVELECSPLDLKLIRDGASNVKVNIQIAIKY